MIRYTISILAMSLYVALTATGMGLAQEPPYFITVRHGNELNRQEFIKYGDGSTETILYTFRNSVDAEGKQITERVDEYVIRIEKQDGKRNQDERTISITDQFGITYSGDDLTREKDLRGKDGVSFVGHHSERVWIRSDGSRLVGFRGNDKPRCELDEGGRLLRTFNRDGDTTSVYGYKTRSLGWIPNSFPPKEKKEIYLTEFMSTNSEGKKEHWKLTEEDKEAGKQIWRLQNHVSGEKIKMKGVDSITVDPMNGDFVLVKTPKSDDLGNTTQITEQWKTDGSTFKVKRIERPDGTVELFKGVYGIDPDHAAYESRTIRHPANGKKPQQTSYVFRSSAGLFNSSNGKFWIKQTDNVNAAEYFQGTLGVLDDGTGIQDGFIADAEGNRLIQEGTPVRHRKLLIYTNGTSMESKFVGKAKDASTARIMRDKHGDILKLVDVNGRATSFGYKTVDAAAGKRHITAIADSDGDMWRTNDNGTTWYNPFTGRKRDPLHGIDLIIDRGTGEVSWETDEDKVTIRLDGTREIHDKQRKTTRTLDAVGRIISCTNAIGTRCELEYDAEGRIHRADFSNGLSLIASGPTKARPNRREETASDIQVDANCRVSYVQRDRESDAVNKHVLFPGGGHAIYSESGTIISVTDPNGDRTEFVFDGDKLTSFARAGAEFKWTAKRTDDGRLTLTKTVNGKDSRIILDDAYVSEEGSLTLEYSAADDGYLAFQTFGADGSRRDVWRDYSFRVHDAQNRIIERQRVEGDLQVFESFEYEGDDPVPVRVYDSFAHWVRGKKPVASSKVAPHRYQWNSDWAPGRGQWVGSFSLDSRGEPVFRKRNAFDHKFTADREITQFMFVGSNAKCRWNTIKDRPEITEDGAGRAFRYEYRGDGSVEWLYELASFEDWTAQTAREAGSELKTINFNKLTGQPILVNFDGSRLIHLLNGAIVSIDAEGKVNRVQTECGQLKVATTRNGRLSSMAYDAKREMKIGIATEDGKVSSLRYDPETDIVSIQFDGGTVATLNWAGDLLVRNKDGRLARTVSAFVFKRPTTTRMVQQFGYDRSGRPDSIVQMKTSPQGQVTTTRFTRQADSDTWFCKSETADDPAITYESIRIDHDSGCQTRRLNASQITEYVNCAGDVVRKKWRWNDLAVISAVRLDADGKVLEVIDSQKNRTQFYRNDAGEITLVTSNGYESMAKREDGTWVTSYDDPDAKTGDIKGSVTVDKDGNQTWTNNDKTVIRYADGSIKTLRADGSYFFKNAAGTETTHGHAGRGKVAKVTIRSDGSGEIEYRDGKRLRRYPNQFLVASVDDKGNEGPTRTGWFVVANNGTITELNATTNKATIYYHHGSTIELERKVFDDGKTVSYLKERNDADRIRKLMSRNPSVRRMFPHGLTSVVDLASLGADDPNYLGPKVGLGAKDQPYEFGAGSSMLRGLDFLKSTPRQARVARIRPWTPPATKVVHIALATRGVSEEPPPRKQPEREPPASKPVSKPKKENPPAPPERDFASYDKNSDGKLTKDELPPVFVRGMSRDPRMDPNRDGAIDAKEFERAAPLIRRLSR